MDPSPSEGMDSGTASGERDERGAGASVEVGGEREGRERRSVRGYVVGDVFVVVVLEQCAVRERPHFPRSIQVRTGAEDVDEQCREDHHRREVRAE